MDKSLLSHWWHKMETAHGGPIPERPPLTADERADVAIVGAGYTGLYTALELLKAEPGLKVVLLDANVAGYGASGRNGGAVIAQLNGSREFWAKRGGGRDAAIAMERAVQAAVVEVGKVITEEGIDCGYAHNGVAMVARTPLEADRFRASVEEDRRFGFGPEDTRYLERDEILDRINIAGALGARFSSHCASVDGGRLARGLAEAVERRGGVIYESSAVLRIEPRRAVTARASVEAKFVVRATEAYSESIKGQERTVVPIHTSMLATEVLTEDQMRQLRWSGHEALLAEHPFLHLQFTSDNRITIGGDDPRVPYLYGSAPSPDAPPGRKVRDHYYRELIKLFPFLDGVEIVDEWQGVFGATKDWAPNANLDRATGLGVAGGYVGEGLAPSNLVGRTMRDLILGRESELTRLPHTNPRLRRWEPEPLRYLGSGVIWAARAVGDAKEHRTDKPSRLITLGNRAAGFSGHLG
ncbi:NAD(P)/FAD-dependent oxidoreductase [Pseudonocardia acaciae]|uniref:NAD(P)/FAD-dependent oxidoreductase n=1 Tax=Pseudonocardia acaciae TaxID=551276 RepID=UPI00048CB5CA|nr:FAD-binding oxidoreductase [Pseudonocardia acaciae]